MVDTEHVLEQMRAANPAPSLEYLAAQDLGLVADIVTRGRSATTLPIKERSERLRPARLAGHRLMHPVLVAALAFILVLGTLGGALLLFRRGGETAAGDFVCPSGSTPDQPGPADQPRPQWDGSGLWLTTFHPGSGRVLMLAGDDLWMFDVCTNTWTTAPGPGDIGIVTDLVYDVDSDRAIAFAEYREGAARVGSYDPDGQTWTVMNEFVVGGAAKDGPLFPWLKAVFDPITGLVVALDATTAGMWTYDVDTDTWTEIDHGSTWVRPPDEPFLTYDASVDRLVAHPLGRSIWEFDIRAGRWEKHTSNAPEGHQGFGWMNFGEEFVYDEANQVSVLFSHGHPATSYVITYDASEHLWTSRQARTGLGPHYGHPPMTYDPVNERIVMMLLSDIHPTAGVIAYDVATGEWVTLLEPSTE